MLNNSLGWPAVCPQTLGSGEERFSSCLLVARRLWRKYNHFTTVPILCGGSCNRNSGYKEWEVERWILKSSWILKATFSREGIYWTMIGVCNWYCIGMCVYVCCVCTCACYKVGARGEEQGLGRRGCGSHPRQCRQGGLHMQCAARSRWRDLPCSGETG